jgi:hypothetical protein
VTAKADSVPPPKRHLAKDDAKEAVLKMFGKTARPILIGTAALQLGPFWTLQKTEALFEELAEAGKIRCLTKLEQEANDLTSGYVLCGVKPA